MEKKEKKSITIRVPLAQYSYLEFEFEGTPDEAIVEHNRILRLYEGGAGLEQKDFNATLDRYIFGDGNMVADDYAAMSKLQQFVISEIRKSKKRSI